MSNPTDPNSFAAEAGIMAAVIANGPEAIAACLEAGVSRETFYFRAHGRTYTELLAMDAEGKPASGSGLPPSRTNSRRCTRALASDRRRTKTTCEPVK